MLNGISLKDFENIEGISVEEIETFINDIKSIESGVEEGDIALIYSREFMDKVMELWNKSKEIQALLSTN